MANLTWGITTDGGSISEDSPAVSEANIQRFVAYLNARSPDLTDAQAFRAWARSEWNKTKKTVIEWEKTQAAIAAKDAVQDIDEV